MGKISYWMNKAQGEMSRLRMASWFFNVHNMYSAPYSLHIEGHVDYRRARDLYYNRDDSYKLGAGFAKPIVNTLSGFMGTPTFTCDDEGAQEDFDAFTSGLISIMQRVHQKNLVDGEVFLRLVNLKADTTLYPENKTKTRLSCAIIPPEQIPTGGLEYDPVTHEYTAVTILTKNKWIDQSGDKQEYTFRQRITPDEIVTTVEGKAPEGLESSQEANPWGFIPIVHFRNEPDETELHGYSELEPIEPFLKAYHDVMIHAISGSKMHSTPKVAFKVSDVAKFMQNNFPQAFKDLKEGKQASIDLQGKELFLLKNDEDAGFIECASAIGDTATLLQFIFYCIIDTSEVPEFAFGVHIASSQASTKEQSPILIRRISRKREQVEDSWKLFARMALAMLSRITGKAHKSYATEVTWDAVMDRDEQAAAQTLYSVTQALSLALSSNSISLQSAVDFLGRYIDTMEPWEGEDGKEGEKERIEQTRLLNMPVEESYTQDQQIKSIDEELNKGAGGGTDSGGENE